MNDNTLLLLYFTTINKHNIFFEWKIIHDINLF